MWIHDTELVWGGRPSGGGGRGKDGREAKDTRQVEAEPGNWGQQQIASRGYAAFRIQRLERVHLLHKLCRATPEETR